MINLSLSELINATHAKAKNCPDQLQFTEVSTDTRTLKKGALFIALVGDNFDGHDFIQAAYERGAAAIMISRGEKSFAHEKFFDSTSLPLLQVTDTRIALGQLAKCWRQKFSIPVIALTGTAGKTTTKTMLASILSHCGEALVTEGTLNNDIGVPLTLLGLNDQHNFAVIEIGTNHFGEIAYATNIAQPTIAGILNAGPGHLEFFGDVAGVAKEKGDIYQGAAVSVINIDDLFADVWMRRVQQHITFSMQKPADVWAENVNKNNKGHPNFTLHIGIQTAEIQLPILGLHNVANALAAAAMLQPLNISIEKIKAGLETFSPVSKRLVQMTGLNGGTLIDDTYNANPSSFHAAINILASFPAQEKILIVGDMGELGERSEHYHIELGKQARESGVDKLYAVGRLSRLAAEAFGSEGYHFSDQLTLIEAVRSILHSKMAVLVKGSKSSKMGNIVAALRA